MGRERNWHGVYLSKKRLAKHRRVPFLLTFEEWFSVWKRSGHLEEMGNRRGQYVMSRREDKGAYEIGNVRIVLAGDNVREALRLNHPTKDPVVRAKIRESRLGEKNWNFGRPRSLRTRIKISRALTGKKHSAASRAKMSESAKRRRSLEMT